MSTTDLSPPGLPDIALLNQLANQLFAAGPAAGPEGFSLATLGGPQGPSGPPLAGGFQSGRPDGFAPATPLNAATPASSATPAGFGSPKPDPANGFKSLGLGSTRPDSFGSAAPAVPGALGSGLPLSENAPAGFGLPTEAQLQERLAPQLALPQAAHAAPPAGAPAFYFIEPDRSARQAASTGAGAAPSFAGFPAATPERPSALPASHGSDLRKLGAAPAGYGLPSEEELLALLTPRQFGGGSTPARDSSSPYYFLEQNGKRQPGVQDPGQRFPEQHAAAGTGAGNATPPFDINLVRRDFPILKERVNGKQLVWLDNAATTHKPQSVIDRIAYFYEHENSNIHRAAHELAARATDAYEGAREKVRGFLNAASPNEIVFVRGATEAINLVAQSWGRQHIRKDDEIIISWLEHHANIVPWQQLCAETGARLRVIPVDDDGQILLDEYAKLLNPRTKLVAFTQVSNALGTVTPAQQIIAMAHAAGARVLVDGAQSVSHLRVNVQALDADWFVFSGHKVFGPTGIGVLYGKEALLNATQPWQGGGNMIKDVTFEHTEYHAAPGRFEAGTGNIADAVGLGAAIDYVNKIGIDNINLYEHQLLQYATALLKPIPGVRLIGTAHDKASVLSFVLDGYSTAEVGDALSKEGIAVRSGHHCAQPILRRFGVEATVRPSLAFYNNCADVDALIAVVRRLSAARR